jgi:4a-hydroxytetrahydrobiopterin dehydratase
MRPSLLSEAEIEEGLRGRPLWTRTDRVIARQLTFPSFRDAIAFTVRLAFEAEEADHHPEILITYKRVKVAFTTHNEGGLTGLDMQGAAKTDAIAATFGAR